MNNCFRNQELVDWGQEVAAMLAEIINGSIDPFSPDIQEWATKKFVQISNYRGSVSDEDRGLFEIVEDCLVDILSCDNASWDTPTWAFEEHFKLLQAMLKERGEARDDGEVNVE